MPEAGNCSQTRRRQGQTYPARPCLGSASVRGSGRMTEVFACGTAAVITPVGRVKANGFEMTIHNEENGPVTMALRDALLGIQHGTAPDTHGWMHTVTAK